MKVSDWIRILHVHFSICLIRSSFFGWLIEWNEIGFDSLIRFVLGENDDSVVCYYGVCLIYLSSCGVVIYRSNVTFWKFL